MKTTLLNLNSGQAYAGPYVLEARLSFKPFVEFLEQKLAEEHTAKAVIYRAALDTFARHPELLQPQSAEDVIRYTDALDQVYTIATPILASEQEYVWAICTPMSPLVFYATDAFHKMFTDEKEGNICCLKPDLIQHTQEEWRINKLTHTYAIILKKLYNLPFGHTDIIHRVTDEKTGLYRYFRLDFDDRFIQVKANFTLPELSLESIQENIPSAASSLQALEKKLPLNQFTFEGLSIITLTDVTAEHAVSTLRDIVVEHAKNATTENFEKVELALKSMTGNPDVNFGLLPLLKINDKYVFKNGIGLKSTLVDLARSHGFNDRIFQGFVHNYVTAPRIVFLRSITPLHQDLSPALKILADNDILSFVIIPLFYQGKLAGVLEVFSDKENIINEKMLSQLGAASLILSQLLQQSIDDLKNDITRVINDKFTPLQPAVQWKFNEAAWHYLIQEQENSSPQVPRIAFEDVYPLYGAVDIRNSTEERNTALKADLDTHLRKLKYTLEETERSSSVTLAAETQEKLNELQGKLKKITHQLSPYQAMKLEDYLHREVPPVLAAIQTNDTHIAAVIENYLQALHPKDGITFQQRRELETSMQLINATVGKTLDNFNDSLQKQYPCYFEKFRTDGVEYDIYAGQSIDPTRPFTGDVLVHIRHKQLEVMALLAQQTKALLPLMPKALQTTQLIFVHGTHIDIAFRADEKRFDVEGSYNIRYQVVKKRIDKAYIKDTAQRLTQPGTIAIVYSGKHEIADYLQSIETLQKAGTLGAEIEWLDLEELQGLTGMKAIRVQVLDGAALA